MWTIRTVFGHADFDFDFDFDYAKKALPLLKQSVWEASDREIEPRVIREVGAGAVGRLVDL